MSEKTAEDWGRVAVSLPGWRWMPGMLDTEGDRWGGVTLHDGAREVLRAVTAPKQYAYEWRDRLPDPDDPATTGCLLALLAPRGVYIVPCDQRKGWWRAIIPAGAWPESAPTLGRACIAAAEALGRWPGGEG